METHQTVQLKEALWRHTLLRLCLLLGLFVPISLQAQTADWQYVHQGNKAFKQGMYHTAESYYKKALQSNPNNIRAQYDLGNVYLALRQDSLAFACYNRVAGGDPSPLVRAMANHNAGVIYQQQAGEAKDEGEKQKRLLSAIDAYKRALRDNPSLDASRYNLVLCQKQLRNGGGGGDKNKKKDDKQGGGNKEQNKQKEKQQNAATPLINYARQAEQKTRNKLNQSRGQRQLEKNW